MNSLLLKTISIFVPAKKFGVTECLNPKDYDKPMQEILKEKTGGDGFDYTFECVGTIETMVHIIINSMSNKESNVSSI